MRDALETRRSKIEARLEHVTSMKRVVTDLRDTHISPHILSDDINDVDMDDGVFIPSPTSPTFSTADAGPSTPRSSNARRPSVVVTKAKILASPIVPVRFIFLLFFISNANEYLRMGYK